MTGWRFLGRGCAGLALAWVTSTLLWLGLEWVAAGWTAGMLTFAVLWPHRRQTA